MPRHVFFSNWKKVIIVTSLDQNMVRRTKTSVTGKTDFSESVQWVSQLNIEFFTQNINLFADVYQGVERTHRPVNKAVWLTSAVLEVKQKWFIIFFTLCLKMKSRWRLRCNSNYLHWGLILRKISANCAQLNTRRIGQEVVLEALFNGIEAFQNANCCY